MMQDMLVRLLDLPRIDELEKELLSKEILIRRPIAAEQSIVVKWVEENFSKYWASEVMVSFGYLPVHCFVAQKENELLGFSCYETTAKNFFGPTGVLDNYQGIGLGKILLIKSLLSLKELGYTYGIIGGVGPASYYEKIVNATIIKGSKKSIYQQMLQ